MCIIVDANVATHLSRPTEDGAPVLRWLLTGGGAMIVGGQLKHELVRAGLQRTMVVLSQAGKLHTLDDDKVKQAAGKLGKHCVSNDCHVIAIAQLSGCRLIFSHDQGLHKDAKNRKILSPTASIYQTKDHKHLLEPCECNM